MDNTLYDYNTNHRGADESLYPLVAEWFPTLAAFEDQYRFYRNQVTNRLKPTGACRSRLHAFIA
ncbi:MAG: hypothetical protein IPK68_19670 [Bdellovibrionales bacterium]|nr:hypothetical protein [Bdellovibrionales bacterium]